MSKTPWENTLEALAHMKPPRGQKWLAEQLHEELSTVNNWKRRGIPARRLRDVAAAVGLTLEQLEGLAPLPWERLGEWPFDDRSLYDRVRVLTLPQRNEIQGSIRKMVIEFESITDERPVTPPDQAAENLAALERAKARSRVDVNQRHGKKSH